LAALDGAVAESEPMLVPVKQGTPAAPPDGIAQVVANRRRHRTHYDDPAQGKLVLGIGQEAGEEQNGLARDRNPGVLQQQSHGYSPVAVLIEEPAQQLEERISHAVSPENLSRRG